MNWHILVVDDEPFNLEIIGEYLDEPDYCLTCAADGELAWSALLDAQATASPVDLVVLDRMMPVLDGMGLLKRIKTDERFRHLPVIMQTAAALPEDIREGIATGAYYYLTKPYRPETLHAIVRAALNDLDKERQALAAVGHGDSALACVGVAEFEFRSLSEAQSLATTLANLCPDVSTAALGLSELLVNAVEHGNLGISYAEKKNLRENDGWCEEVARRLELPELRDRVARVRMVRHQTEIEFTVEDQGAGFDWRHYLSFDPCRAFDPNGRGIAVAKQISFSRLEYRGCGNVVVAAVRIGTESAAGLSMPSEPN